MQSHRALRLVCWPEEAPFKVACNLSETLGEHAQHGASNGVDELGPVIPSYTRAFR
jgi:hypothetical protein